MKSPLLFQNQPVVRLADADSEVLVAPGHGARVLRWSKAGREIITWPGNADWGNVAKVRGGNPVLFPFLARHFVDGKNEFWRDEKGKVRSMPQHGFAKAAKFAVIDDGAENSLRMRLKDSEYTRKLYPFAFEFDVVVNLLPNSRLEVRFETANTGADPLPYYAGHHFYFAVPHEKRADWTLQLACERWAWHKDGLLTQKPAEPGRFHLDDDAARDRIQIKPRGEVVLRNDKTGQCLTFELEHAGSAPWYAVTTWTEFPNSDFYCIEPWLGLPDAIHHGEGLRKVAPGAKETATVVLDGSGW